MNLQELNKKIIDLEKGYDYFYLDDRRAIDRRIYNAPYTTPAHEIKNFPYDLYEEKTA